MNFVQNKTQYLILGGGIINLNLRKTVAGLVLATLALASVARAGDNNDFSHVDPQGIVPKRPLNQALAYFKKYRTSFSNDNVITVIDFTRKSNQKRMFIVNLNSGSVEALQTSHGRGSDPNDTGYAKRFSNEDRSYASSLGFYRTAGTYSGKHGLSLRLEGLSPTNDNAEARAVVVHGADYVNDNGQRVGRSHGCPAVSNAKRTHVISTIKGGSLMYIWAGQEHEG